ncbi:hypothetical protein [Chitinophaga polysaccharea]|uniref:hypothetical protein n=1 Tax=Chitinophaga polysaccharea TaxID=1293035 RepID=UPI001157F05B|nr:hypothetical protein [Chitinophaga polysaccharea]
MTITSYKRLKQALIKQRREVTASPQAASRFIDDLGLRDIVITSAENAAAPKKAATRKAVPKKAASK